MNRYIVGIIVSRDATEREKQRQAIRNYTREMKNELFGIMDLSYSFSIKELQRLLQVLENEGTTTIIGSIPSRFCNTIEEQVEKTKMEFINITDRVFYKDKKYMFIICKEMNVLDMEMMVKILSDALITDIYVLVENTDSINKYAHKIHTVAKSMNINVHYFQNMEDLQNSEFTWYGSDLTRR